MEGRPKAAAYWIWKSGVDGLMALTTKLGVVNCAVLSVMPPCNKAPGHNRSNLPFLSECDEAWRRCEHFLRKFPHSSDLASRHHASRRLPCAYFPAPWRAQLYTAAALHSSHYQDHHLFVRPPHGRHGRRTWESFYSAKVASLLAIPRCTQSQKPLPRRSI